MAAKAMLDLKNKGSENQRARKQPRLQAVAGSKGIAEAEKPSVWRLSKKVLLLSFLVASFIPACTYFYKTMSEMFAIQHVQIKGELHNEQAQQVESVLSQYLQGDLLTVNLTAAHSALQKISWLYQAQLRREWPGTIVVNIKEHVPVAFWNKSNLLSNDGRVFQHVYATELNDLPELEGPSGRERDVMHQFASIRELLAGSELSIRSLKVDERNTWIMTTHSGITIRLGGKDFEQRLNRLLLVLSKEIGTQLGSMKEIDLRHSNGFAVSWRKNSPNRTAERGQRNV